MTETIQQTDRPVDQPVEVSVSDLTVVYRTDLGELPAVSRASIDLVPGQITGLVGESGSGKSTLALAMLNAVPSPGRISSGSITVTGLGDVTKLAGRKLRHARGGTLGYVFQASQNSLNPLKTIGKQLLDLGRAHDVRDLRALVRRAAQLISEVGLDPDRVLDSYQHELSGGMRQRIGIVLALVLNARVLILDEPTTALDVLSQAAVLDIVRRVHRDSGLTTLIVTHDLGVVSEIADRLVVMYGGPNPEEGPATAVLHEPSHPYTRALIGAMARIVGDISAARVLPGRPPDLTTVPRQGCVFRDRCPLAMPVCAEEEPELVQWTPGRRRACHVEPTGVLS
ncbi:ABC transporter ATP-binding protein [Hamadaea tsunoensis]|uniref:ABC transporter ATP-binding protein n=1 Tax=Hamadaea tsunoensis TaxID=53368 RepID=UPI000400F960|nr:ABC transporter ATP-binding protein [Hamadaea tsunoensis]